MSDATTSKAPAVIASRKPFFRELRAGQTVKWCSCGRSRRQPFCDGVSHAGTGYEPITYRAEQAEEVLLCGCKQTGTPPFCDGAHSNIPGGYEDEPTDEALPFTDPDAVGRARLDGQCFVMSPAQDAPTGYACQQIVSPGLGAQYQSQFHLVVSAGTSPVLASDDGDVVIWVAAGRGSIVIEGRGFAIDGPCGLLVRKGEAFQLAFGNATIRAYVSLCPGAEALVERAAMTANFDEDWPERVAAIDEAARTAMGPRYFQVLLDERHGLRNTAQFIGHIPRSKASMHRHLYEEALIILTGSGVIWNETCRARVKAGDVIFFPRKHLHSLQCDCDEGMDVVGLIHPGTNPGINYF